MDSTPVEIVSYATTQAPVVNAGSNQTINLPSSLKLNGTATGTQPIKTTWSKVSGPGTVTFVNATVLNTTVTFSTSGSYVLRLTGTNAYGTSTSNVTITVNQAPVVNAGLDQTITLPASAMLNAAVSGSGTITTTWSEYSGPGTVAFVDVNALSTTASFSTSGSYVLRLTGTNAYGTSTSNVTITVNLAPTIGLTFYMSASGNDSNSGSSISPWRTIQKAADTLSGGGTVIVAPGTYDERVTVSHSGSSGSYIVFQVESGGTRPIMRGFTINANYIRVDGFEITHSTSIFPACNNDNDTNGAGVYMCGGSNIEAVNNFIHDTARSGALVLGSNNIVRNNTITTAAFDGIWLKGSNQLAEGNDISGTVASLGSCLWTNK